MARRDPAIEGEGVIIPFRSTPASENLARAAREGGVIQSDIADRMEPDRQRAEDANR